MRVYIVLALSILLVGCDSAYPPIIANDYNQPIEITVSFTNGESLSGIRLLPRVELVQRRKGLNIRQITVVEPSGTQRVFGAVELRDVRSGRKIEFEVWILSESGIRLRTKEDLKRFKSE